VTQTKPRKKKASVTPNFTQEEAKELASGIERYILTLTSIGDIQGAVRMRDLRQKVVDASGRVPDANETTNVQVDSW
jgi:hypothetical protein